MLPFRIVRIGGTAFRRQATCYSVISQLISINQPLGNQFMIFAKGRIKLLSGSPAPSRGGQSRPRSSRPIRSRLVFLL